MTLWQLACYFAVFLGGVAGGWITCAVFTAARVNELQSEVGELWARLRGARAAFDLSDETVQRLRLELQTRNESNPSA